MAKSQGALFTMRLAHFVAVEWQTDRSGNAMA